ncbi:hypothetical protein IU449_10265 [Nocardia higoensis]|uniref:Uncharacterized protein n=1 Tax=Nocardia higoensis TaxID=228599 RepID=A0ABS0D8Z1_9NOCA|nr:hypothetical protein [Nocardia higoensis]MBF6354925.1 hypothetical protein [Nocardia higoensis]
MTMVMAAIATGLCCAMKMWADVTAFEDDELWLTVGLLVAIPVTVWFVLIVVACIRYAGWWRLGLLVPAFVAVTVALAGFSVPGRIGWLVTRSEMDQAAAACDKLQSGRSGGSYASEAIGMYQFHHIESGPAGECEFYFSRYYPGVRSGFMYLPNGEALVSDIDHKYVRLDDSWYYFRT